MEKKKKPAKHKKSKIEKQYEEFFNYIGSPYRIMPIQQPAPSENIQTWVRYGVGQIEILGVKII